MNRFFSDAYEMIRQKCPSLLPADASPLARVYENACIGSFFPDFWLETPLLGAPHADLHVMYDKADLPDNCTLPGNGFGYQPLFSWLAAQGDPGAGIAFSIDVREDGRVSAGSACLLPSGMPETGEAYYTACGHAEAIQLFRRTLQLLPPGWTPWYVASMQNRTGRYCRVDCYISGECTRSYSEDPALFSRHLTQLGYSFDSFGLCAFAAELAAPGFPLEIQLDRLADGSMRNTIALSVSFGEIRPAELLCSFETGSGATLASLLRSRGMADERMEQISKTITGRIFPEKLIAGTPNPPGFHVKPIFIKTVWENGEPQPAKLYSYVGKLSRSSFPDKY